MAVVGFLYGRESFDTHTYRGDKCLGDRHIGRLVSVIMCYYGVVSVWMWLTSVGCVL